MWLWLAEARATIPVVVDGVDGAATVTRVAQKTGLPATQFGPTRLDQLLTADPGVLGDATIRRCSKDPSTNLELQAELVRAESAWTTARSPSEAMDHLDLLVARMGCLGEIVDPKVASDAFALRGGVASDQGDLDMARGELRTALDFAPDLTWAPRWPATGQALLEQQRAIATSAKVTAVPGDASTGPWLDGREVKAGLPVAPGLHLFQYGTGVGIRSAWLTVGGDAELVVPGNYRRPVLERIEKPETQAEIEALLQVAIPSFQAAYVSVEGGIWLVTAQDGAVSTTVIAPAAPAPAPDTGKKHGKKGG